MSEVRLGELRQWIGRRRTVEETLARGQAEKMAATLDREAPLRDGDPLPPAWHWIYFNEAARQSELGPDGHAKRGGFLPPVPLPRRMWAGGRLVFHRPLRVGSTVTRVSEVRDVTVKEGRSGTLVFVLVHHAMSDEGGLALEEEHDLVYREATPEKGGAPAASEPVERSDWSREIRPDPVLLFRYSALTFNGHRIHYDEPYVTKVENYPGLVVHGPLTVTLLLDLATRHLPAERFRRFAFRGVRPLFDTAPFTVNGAASAGGARLWAANEEGAVAMRAELELG